MAAVVLSAVSSVRSSARDAQRISQAREVQKALDMYWADIGQYPPFHNSSSGYFTTHITNYLVNNGYLSSAPADPLNTGDYWYRYYSHASSANYNGLCDGRSFDDYEYVLFVNTENDDSFTNHAQSTFSSWNLCFPGPLR